MKLISVITVVFNDINHIGKTIESVLEQNISASELEYIIIDGGSTDGTVDEINKYIDRIDIFLSEKDSGIYNAMNKGVGVATGKWCLFLNSGDLLVKDAVQVVLKEQVDENIAIIYGNTICSFPRQGQVRYNVTFKEGDFPPVGHQSAFISTKVMKKYGYDETYHICADLDFFKKVFDAGYIFHYVNCDISIYDMNGMSAHNIIKFAKEKKKIGFKVSPIDFIKFYIKEILFRVMPNLYMYLLYKSVKRR